MTKTDSSTWRDYYILLKPGIIRGNLLTAIGGFFLATHAGTDWGRLLALLCGMALVIGGSCVFNNIYDKDIDSRMPRTNKRALVNGNITTRQALVYGTVVSVIGMVILLFGTNILTTVLGILGLVTYVGLYTPAKHRTPYATLLGTIPGALPPVAGYTAITNRLDLAGALLFAILVCWQMPHFFAIAIRRLDEYKAAGVPIWPSVHGIRQTKIQMILFALALVGFIMLLSLNGYTSVVFAVVLGGYSLYWAYACWQGLAATDDTSWAKRVFLLSLPILPLFSVLLILNRWLP